MSFLDLVLLILDNLSRRKARVALTAVGVVIGTAAVVVLVSLAIGLQRNATQQLGSIGDLTSIWVMPQYGGEGPVMQGPGSGPPQPTVLITDQTLQDLAAIPGVKAVVPRDYLMFGGTLQLDKLETYPNIMGAGVDDLGVLDMKAQTGLLALTKGGAVVGSQVARNFYDPRMRPGQPTPTPPDLMDANLKLIVIKTSTDGTEMRRAIPLKVTGVIAESRGESDYSIYVSLETVTALNEWGLGRRINRNREGYSQVLVKVADSQQVLEINDQITAMGFMANSPQSFVQGINSFYVILQVIFGGVGAIALLVAAIGIANTMAMAILERTREIGLLKAVGATNRDVLSIFLGEAAGIGFLGGLGGVLVGWSAGQVLNILAVVYLTRQAAQTGGPPPSVAVFTPLWLPVFTLIFATIMGMVSGLYPALRAANLIPVTALKYE